MPRSLDNRYLDNFGIPKDHPIWQHWEEEARRAGRSSIKRFVIDLLLDRDSKLWGNGNLPPEVTPTDLWFPGGSALVDLASLEALQTLLSGVVASPRTAASNLTIDEDAASANAAAWLDDDE